MPRQVYTIRPLPAPDKRLRTRLLNVASGLVVWLAQVVAGRRKRVDRM
jgi:hypothetical protein